MTLEQRIKEMMEEAWTKMGFPGDEDYNKRATKQEVYYAGRYRALEDILDYIEENN